jgi:hypothetical protein
VSGSDRVVIWFSCGVTSAVAAKLAIAMRPHADFSVVYIDTGSEHADNERFLADVSVWIDRPIETIRSERYADTWAVFEGRRYLSGIAGAPCTLELKKAVRERWEKEHDWTMWESQVFGFDADEAGRAQRFLENQPEVRLWTPLITKGMSKDACMLRIQEVGIELPTMYKLGYRNNNCIGCVKGNAGYWNKIRNDFPETFARMAMIERELGAKICQATINGTRQHVSLDDLPPDAGRYSDEPPISCGLLCQETPQPTSQKENSGDGYASVAD